MKCLSQSARLHCNHHFQMLFRYSRLNKGAYLDKEAQVDVFRLRLGPVDLAILLVADVDTLKDEEVLCLGL